MFKKHNYPSVGPTFIYGKSVSSDISAAYMGVYPLLILFPSLLSLAAAT